MDKVRLAFFGHHKCASTWISHIIQRLCIETGRPYWLGQLQLVEEVSSLNDLEIEYFICSNTSFDKVNELNFDKAFHVVRDPRDIIVSGYFSHLKTHDTSGWDSLLEHREALQSLDQKDGLMREMEFSRYFFEHLERWDFNSDNIMEVKMEDLTATPLETFEGILNFQRVLADENRHHNSRSLINRVLNRMGPSVFSTLRLPNQWTTPHLQEVLEQYDFKRLSKGRKPGEEDQSSHYRKGQAGDWQNYFDADLKERFNELYGDLLIRLGYEHSLGW